MGYIFKALQILVILSFTLKGYAGSTKQENTGSLNELIQESCNKQIVILGEEANHGSSKVISLKLDIVKRLVDECGFSAVFFESSVYEFSDFNSLTDNKIATKAHLANSIGGNWSFAQESDALINFLFEKTQAGDIHLAGLDLQAAGLTSVFTQTKLAENLTKHLLNDQQKKCQEELNRHFNWLYNKNHPFNDKSQLDLYSCTQNIIKSLTNLKSSEEKEVLTLLASNFLNYLSMMKGDSFNIRDKQMYDNFLWYKAKLSQGAKVIIWTATIHSLKNATIISKKTKPLGYYIHQHFGDKAFAVGISAQSGTYYSRMQQKPVKIKQEPIDSLEQSAKITKDYVYFNAKKLKLSSKISSHVIDYNKSYLAQWDEILDAIIVIKDEKVPNYIYPKKAR